MTSRREFLGRTGGMAAVGTAAVLAGDGTARATTPSNYPFYNVTDFGAVGDGTTDNVNFIQNAVNAAAVTGGVVYFPPGTYMISGTINMLNWVALKGEGRASEIRALPGFAQQNMFYAANGTGSMFYSRLDDLSLNANDVAGILNVVLALAWQESSGANRLVVQKFRNSGITLANGYGGASWTRLSEIELFGSQYGSAYGIHCAPMGSVGAFMLNASCISIAGYSATAPMTNAIFIDGDSLVADTVHVEYCANGIQLAGIGDRNIRGVTGSYNAVGDLVVLASNLTGSVVLQTINPNGASRAYINNNTGASSTTTVAHLVVQQ
jgi:hypothetical protein